MAETLPASRFLRCVAVVCLALALGGTSSSRLGSDTGSKHTSSGSNASLLALQRGEVAHLMVEQDAADLVVAVRAPDGEVRLFDGFAQGPEPVSFIASVQGPYEISASSGNSVSRVRLVASTTVVRHPSARDLDKVEAAGLATEAKQLERRNSRASLAESTKLLVEAIGLWRAADEPAIERNALRRLGDLQYSSGHYEDAQRSFESALQISRRMNDTATADLIAEIGLCRWRLGSPDEALALLTESRDLFAARRDRSAAAGVVIANLGLLYCQAGDCNSAINLYREAIAIARDSRDLHLEARLVSNLGKAYETLGDLDSSGSYHRRALAMFARLQDKSEQGNSLSNLGSVSLQRKQIKEASELFSRAYALLLETADVRGLASVQIGLCKARMEAGDWRDGAKLCGEALNAYRRMNDQQGEAAALSTLAGVYQASGANSDAMKALRQALNLWQRLSIPEGEAQTLSSMASLSLRLGDLSSADYYVNRSISLLEGMRAKVLSEPLRISYFSTRQAAYRIAVEALMERNRQEPNNGFDVSAFQIAEQTRARSLLELIGDPRTGSSDLVGARTMQNVPSGQRVSSVEAGRPELYSSTTTFRQGVNVSSTSLPAGVASGLENTEYVSSGSWDFERPSPDLRDLQAHIDPGSVLIEFFVSDSKAYAWVISASRIDSVELQHAPDMMRNATFSSGLIADVDALNDNSRTSRLRRALNALSSELLLPLAPLLSSKTLMIVPDSALAVVPWAALPSPTDSSRLLIDEHEIVTLPSASVLLALRERRAQSTSASIAVFADPVFDATDPRVKKPTDNGPSSGLGELNPASSGGQLSRLPFSRNEANEIQRLIPSGDRLVALGFDASKKRLADPSISKYRYLHFATHAIISEQRPQLSSIVLSQVDPNGRPMDGLVRLRDIYNLKLNADLVVLSACESGLGKKVAGEGTIGLGRAFLIAGARSVMVSMWPVEDGASAWLMNEFYKNVFGPRHLSPASALRAAQESARRNPRWKDPYYWSGFSLVGG